MSMLVPDEMAPPTAFTSSVGRLTATMPRGTSTFALLCSNLVEVITSPDTTVEATCLPTTSFSSSIAFSGRRSVSHCFVSTSDWEIVSPGKMVRFETTTSTRSPP